ncbi:MAG: hypothetical protein WBC33_03840 [Conexibacter sp.]
MGERLRRRSALAHIRADAVASDGHLDAAAVAWVLAIPCGLIAAAVAYLLGPRLGALIHTPRSLSTIWPFEHPYFKPEPTEQARYLLALLAPVLLATGIALGPRHGLRLSPHAARLVRWTTQLALGGLVAASIVAQYRLHYVWQNEMPSERYFTPQTLVVAGAIAAALLVVLRVGALHRAAAALLRESRSRRVAATALAVAMTVTWLLHAINSDTSLTWADHNVLINFPFTFDDAFAVVNGRTPFVDYVPLYSSLWPFVTALPLMLVAKTALAFTITMASISALSLLAVYGVLRRVTRSSVAGLLLYLPFLATSLFRIRGTYASPHTPATYMQIFPLRYAGPLLLAWIVARRLDRGGTAARWPIFALAGLVAMNNLEFGGAALAATVAAFVWTSRDLRPDTLLRLLRDLAIGLAAAVAIVAAIALVRTGSLPRLGTLFDYPRLFASGLAMEPLPGVLGLHFVLYLTYGAVLAVATVRAAGNEPNRTLTGMLAWSGIFGFGAAAYFVGETSPITMKALFGAWMLALMLLVVVVVQQLARQRSRWPGPAQLAVLAGLGVAACSLAQTLTPWSQIERLRMKADTVSRPYVPLPEQRDFFASLAWGRTRFYVKEGAPAAFLNLAGHRIADAYGIIDVSPYGHITLAPTREMLRRVVGELRRAGGNTLFVEYFEEAIYRLLAALGFLVMTESGLRTYRRGLALQTVRSTTKWVDARNLHPRALRGGRGRLVVSP